VDDVRIRFSGRQRRGAWLTISFSVVFMAGFDALLCSRGHGWKLTTTMVAVVVVPAVLWMADRLLGSVTLTDKGISIRTPARRRTVEWNRIDYLRIKTRPVRASVMRTVQLHRVPGLSITLPVLSSNGNPGPEQVLHDHIQTIRTA
jgi:hypothetical protein